MSTRPDPTKYERVQKPRVEGLPNEIRVTNAGVVRNFINYAINLLTGANETQVHDTVHLKALGRAIPSAVTVAEILKRRVPGLHQRTTLESIQLDDEYRPREEGLDAVHDVRKVSSMTITLTRNAADVAHDGFYQVPLAETEIEAQREPIPRAEGEAPRRGRGRGGRGGRGRGGRGGRGGRADGAAPVEGGAVEAAAPVSQEEGAAPAAEGGRGRGRPRNRRGRRGGRGRGGRGGSSAEGGEAAPVQAAE